MLLSSSIHRVCLARIATGTYRVICVCGGADCSGMTTKSQENDGCGSTWSYWERSVGDEVLI